MRSIAKSISSKVMTSFSRRAATMAASFMRFWRDAPEKPMAREAMASKSTSGAAGLVRQVHGDAAVEAARSQQGVVEDVGAVRRGDDDHARVAREAVHLRQDLVESLLALIVGREASTAGPLAPNRVDLVDENDARRVLLRVSEQASDATGADADEHLDELGTGAGDERDTGLAGDRASE